MANLNWHKSSYSSDSGNCVQVAAVPSYIVVRDSKDPTGPMLVFSQASWRAFVASPPTRA